MLIPLKSGELVRLIPAVATGPQFNACSGNPRTLLQRLLGLPTPHYHHHRLIRDAAGKRLAKRDDARALSLFRAEGAKPEDIRRMVGL